METKNVFTVNTHKEYLDLTLSSEVDVLEHKTICAVFEEIIKDTKKKVIVRIPEKFDVVGDGFSNSPYLTLIGNLQKVYDDAHKSFFAMIFESEDSSFMKKDFMAYSCYFCKTLEDALDKLSITNQ